MINPMIKFEDGEIGHIYELDFNYNDDDQWGGLVFKYISKDIEYFKIDILKFGPRYNSDFLFTGLNNIGTFSSIGEDGRIKLIGTPKTHPEYFL